MKSNEAGHEIVSSIKDSATKAIEELRVIYPATCKNAERIDPLVKISNELSSKLKTITTIHDKHFSNQVFNECEELSSYLYKIKPMLLLQNLKEIKSEKDQIKEVVTQQNKLIHEIISKIDSEVKKQFDSIKADQICNLMLIQQKLKDATDSFGRLKSLLEKSLSAAVAKKEKRQKEFLVFNAAVESTKQLDTKISALEKEISSVKIENSVLFGTLFDLHTDTKEIIRGLFDGNPEMQTRLLSYIKTIGNEKDKEQIAGNDDPLPMNDTQQCSLTELEDFVYSVMDDKKNTRGKDVCLEEMLAISKRSNSSSEESAKKNKKKKSNVKRVPSPIPDESSADNLSLKPSEQFDPKKIKKIEFSDDKLKNQLKDAKSLHNTELDKVALKDVKGNAPMLYKEYSKVKKDLISKKPYLNKADSTSNSFIISSETTIKVFNDSIKDSTVIDPKKVEGKQCLGEVQKITVNQVVEKKHLPPLLPYEKPKPTFLDKITEKDVKSLVKKFFKPYAPPIIDKKELDDLIEHERQYIGKVNYSSLSAFKKKSSLPCTYSNYITVNTSLNSGDSFAQYSALQRCKSNKSFCSVGIANSKNRSNSIKKYHK